MKALPVVAALLLALAPAARAADDLSNPVAGHPGFTQFDLLKLVVTDLAHDADGSVGGKTVVPFVHLEGKDALVDLPDPLKVVSIEVVPMPGDPSREIMLADFGQSEGFVADGELMMLFSLDPKPRLLDVVQVGSDRFVAWVKPVEMLAKDAPLLVIESEHDNSNQAYLSTAMATVRGDKFIWIDSIFTFNEHYCGWQRMQTPAIKPHPVKGSAYAAIDVRAVEETSRIEGDECGDDKIPKPSKRVFDTLYVWNLAKKTFTPNNKSIETLSKEDQKRF